MAEVCPMGAPRKVRKFQLVKIQFMQSLTDSIKPNPALVAVTKQVKPGKGMCQATTQVNVVSPVIAIVVEADAVHWGGRQHWAVRHGKCGTTLSGSKTVCMTQDGRYVNLGEPLASQKEQSIESTSLTKQGFQEELMVVGLTDSTPNTGKPFTWGSGQQWSDKLSTVFLMNTQRFIQ